MTLLRYLPGYVALRSRICGCSERVSKASYPLPGSFDHYFGYPLYVLTSAIIGLLLARYLSRLKINASISIQDIQPMR